MSEGVVRQEASTVTPGGYIAPAIGRVEQALYFTTAPSVTEKAKQVLSEGRLAVPGAVVVWDETIGRRKGSKAVPGSWWADSRSLTVAFALPQRNDLDAQERLNRAGAAVVRAAASFRPTAPVTFRPPNDLLIEGLKVGAVFFEAHAMADLVIIRLNCVTDLQKAPPPIAAGATRLIDYFDPDTLPLRQAGTLPNTLLTRLMTVIPDALAAP
jgi:hypothetical protein